MSEINSTDEEARKPAASAEDCVMYEVFAEKEHVQYIYCSPSEIDEFVDSFVKQANKLGFDLKNVTYHRK